jgi:lysozyme
MLRGIDVSAENGEIDWARVRAAGMSFCFIRAAYGDVADERAMANLEGARTAGLVCGVYHFLRISRNAALQIRLMENLITTLRIGPGQLPVVVDVEDDPHYDGAWKCSDNEPYLALLTGWITAMQARLGTRPLIYTRAGFWEQLGKPATFTDCPLWVASYHPHRPTLPAGWSDFAFWQSSKCATVDGVPGQVDVSYFHSADPAALMAMTLKATGLPQRSRQADAGSLSHIGLSPHLRVASPGAEKRTRCSPFFRQPS